MTPQEKNIVKSLVAVAWVDGQMEDAETTVVEGLLVGFDASEEEEREMLEYARTPRSLEADLPLGELDREDRELLLANAALLTHADGYQSVEEKEVLAELVKVLEFSPGEATEILDSVKDGALQLGTKPLESP